MRSPHIWFLLRYWLTSGGIIQGWLHESIFEDKVNTWGDRQKLIKKPIRGDTILVSRSTTPWSLSWVFSFSVCITISKADLGSNYSTDKISYLSIMWTIDPTKGLSPVIKVLGWHSSLLQESYILIYKAKHYLHMKWSLMYRWFTAWFHYLDNVFKSLAWLVWCILLQACVSHVKLEHTCSGYLWYLMPALLSFLRVC